MTELREYMLEQAPGNKLCYNHATVGNISTRPTGWNFSCTHDPGSDFNAAPACTVRTNRAAPTEATYYTANTCCIDYPGDGTSAGAAQGIVGPDLNTTKSFDP
jgi:hypothetical protein